MFCILGLQRRRLIPAPLPEAASLGRKPSVTGQWVDLPPLPGTLKEPFEIKVYEIDDVERLQRHRQEETEVSTYFKTFVDNLNYSIPAESLLECWNGVQKIDCN